ncbi:hypothetical protein PBY51_015440 [Eleginops maclovinus]|uniref:Uncharacterized protein n=1 Tax=Eleginops maclovinus TaxID=56733 RepID=A0AAN7X7G2_ELEMC|nr:hypothetical protein PBY51_015440 [Eleginops maclovinus]
MREIKSPSKKKSVQSRFAFSDYRKRRKWLLLSFPPVRVVFSPPGDKDPGSEQEQNGNESPPPSPASGMRPCV